MDSNAEQKYSGLLITSLKEGDHCLSLSCSIKSLLFCEKGFYKHSPPQYKVAQGCSELVTAGMAFTKSLLER